MFEQDPTAGSLVDPSSTVTIVISEGPGTVIVPNVLGDEQSAAENELNAAGLGVQIDETETTDPDEDGVVLDQFPGPGSQARPGETITIRVGVLADDVPEPVPGDTTGPIEEIQ